MRRSLLLPLGAALLGTIVHACAATQEPPAPTSAASSSGSGVGGGAGGAAAVTSTATGTSAGPGGGVDEDATFLPDVVEEEPPISPDAACAMSAEQAEATILPVDIIWMVDNSASMAPAIDAIKQGMNAFATLVDGKNLDYRVIMLSLRGPMGPVMVNGGNRYPICIPPPLAGDANCGDGMRFFQSSIDIRSTQPLEQFLGTLGQTAGYTAADAKGGEPWAGHLRGNATKTIVVVTDDNARLSATDFELFAGGKNPFNSLTLPPGILDSSWNGLFDDYLFSGIYGWGADADPSVKCTFADQTQPASSGPTYTTLVTKTKGVRAKICDGAAAWQPFFDAVAQAVVSTAKLSCEIAIPPPSMGVLDPDKVNVAIGDDANPVYLPGVATAADCAGGPGWYYDDPVAPTKVILCPASCADAQAAIGPGKPGHIQVLFGCSTIAK